MMLSNQLGLCQVIYRNVFCVTKRTKALSPCWIKWSRWNRLTKSLKPLALHGYIWYQPNLPLDSIVLRR
jgi:hypothetical protein